MSRLKKIQKIRMAWSRFLILSSFSTFWFVSYPFQTASSGRDSIRSKPRVIVTTDGEIDDRCSMVRFLLYTSEWDVRGLIHSSSKHHWKGDGDHAGYRWEGTRWLDDQIDAYEKVYPNLRLHHPEFPSPARLREQVFIGNVDLEGDMRAETPGSDRIVKVLLDPDPSPVWLQAWGGPNTIARALKTIEDKHPQRMEEVSRKAKIFLISQQDPTFKNYIRKEWPTVDSLLSSGSAYGAIAYRWGEIQPPEIKKFFDREWMVENILTGHGPICEMYEAKEGRFRSEGDSPAFLHLIDVGLRSSEDPVFGGWGGRFRKFRDHYWKSVDGEGVRPHSILRWAADFQNDWAARADWCVTNFAGANHPPVMEISGQSDRRVRPGEVLELIAPSVVDPDGDSLRFFWWQHDEADTASTVAITNSADGTAARFTVPDEPGKSIHIILEVADDGVPSLKRWRRFVLTIMS